ncbi:hypothetical protein CCACVL1_09024 [Corchorus capsularis]|uniref:Uncharacterized protein n=1 Tax=Corchorus capsularis TaxID=210143 RepID=A0A1R3IY06_COCAP|nr:hypothetical protein CCACVL1_09024 [Corchorus capsularis]
MAEDSPSTLGYSEKGTHSASKGQILIKLGSTRNTGYDIEV